jgi:hypothetical protein
MFFFNQSINTTIKRRQDPQQIFHRFQNNTNCTTISRLFSQNTRTRARERERGIYVDAPDTYLPTYLCATDTYLPTYMPQIVPNLFLFFGGQFCDVAKSGDHPWEDLAKNLTAMS